LNPFASASAVLLSPGKISNGVSLQRLVPFEQINDLTQASFDWTSFTWSLH